MACACCELEGRALSTLRASAFPCFGDEMNGPARVRLAPSLGTVWGANVVESTGASAMGHRAGPPGLLWTPEYWRAQEPWPRGCASAAHHAAAGGRFQWRHPERAVLRGPAAAPSPPTTGCRPQRRMQGTRGRTCPFCWRRSWRRLRGQPNEDVPGRHSGRRGAHLRGTAACP